MSNVNSEDPVKGEVNTTGSGGSKRVEETTQPAPSHPRSFWNLAGLLLATIVLLFPVVWIVVVVGRAIGRFPGSQIDWLYAALLVAILAVVVWLLSRIFSSRRG